MEAHKGNIIALVQWTGVFIQIKNPSVADTGHWMFCISLPAS